MNAIVGWIGVPWYVLALGIVAMGYLAQEISRAFCEDFGLKDYPNRRKIHGFPVPVSGGPGLFLPLLVLYVIWMVRGAPGLDLLRGGALGVASVGIFATGFVDDLKGLTARRRLWIQGAMALILWLAGYRLDAIHFGGWTLDLAVFSLPITLFWFLGFMNTSNLVDGMDGLAGGINLIALVAIGVYGFAARSVAGPISLIIAGLVVMFLFYNFGGRRKIFLGDSGSLGLGLCVAVMAIVAGRVEGAVGLKWVALGLPVAAYTFGITDVIYAIIRRCRNGTSPFTPDSHHIHHKLLRSGMAQGQIRALFYFPGAAMTLLVATAVTARPWVPVALGLAAGLLVMSGVIALRHLLRLQTDDMKTDRESRVPRPRVGTPKLGERRAVARKVAS